MSRIPIHILLFLFWIEIMYGPGRGSVMARVMDSEFRAPLYWIERSNDAGRTWTPYRQAENGDWIQVGSIPSDSMFRARL